MTNCIFCKIVKDEIPSSKVYEDKATVAVLDIAPANKGHIVVIPKTHSNDITEQKSKGFENMLKTVHKIAKACFSGLSFNVLINTGNTSGQIVMHTHVHIIPRHEKDKVVMGWEQQKYDVGEADKVLSNLKNKLEKIDCN